MSKKNNLSDVQQERREDGELSTAELLGWAEFACWTMLALQLATILSLGVLVLNTGYGFEGSSTRLGEYQFVSRALNGHEATEQHAPRTLGNRFRDTTLAAIPVRLPANFVMGIDIQRSDFERKKWSYLAGQWRLGGWWYF